MQQHIIIDHVGSSAELNNGQSMPMLGLGVYLSRDGREVINAIKWALEAGYRSIDTASFYNNESGVGTGVRESGIDRSEVFVTTKVWNSDQGYDQTLRAFDLSMKNLNLDYVDLYLVHWPVNGLYKDTYRALETIYQEGRAKSIGVSNFLIHHLDDLLQNCEVVPTVNQIEFHPYLVQQDLLDYCHEHHILPQAWSPLMQGHVLKVPEIIALGEQYGKTPVQIVLPKSSRQQRIVDNAELFYFEISAEDVAKLDALDRGQRFGPDPDSF